MDGEGGHDEDCRCLECVAFIEHDAAGAARDDDQLLELAMDVGVDDVASQAALLLQQQRVGLLVPSAGCLAWSASTVIKMGEGVVE